MPRRMPVKLPGPTTTPIAVMSDHFANLAGDFIQFAKSSQDLFDSLQQLDLPPIELFNDAAIQQEFQEITKKLK